MRVALYFVITLFGSIGMGWWSLGWGCCVVRVELVCWRLIWFQCHYLVGWLVMLCSLVSFLWWLVCRGDVGWWSWCCDSRDCGGLRGIRVSLWFLGVHLFDACFVVKRVLWFWTIREIWVIYIVVLIKVMRWLLLSGCDSWFLSWCCKLWFLGWVWWCFGVICLWSGFGAVSGLTGW